MHNGENTVDMKLWIFGPIPLLNHSALNQTFQIQAKHEWDLLGLFSWEIAKIGNCFSQFYHFHCRTNTKARHGGFWGVPIEIYNLQYECVTFTEFGRKFWISMFKLFIPGLISNFNFGFGFDKIFFFFFKTVLTSLHVNGKGWVQASTQIYGHPLVVPNLQIIPR